MKSKFKFGAYLVVVLSTIFSIMMILSLSVYFFGIAIPIGIHQVRALGALQSERLAVGVPGVVGPAQAEEHGAQHPLHEP